MPNLDVSEALVDPDFCETITIRRIAQAVAHNGKAIQTETLISATAVVTMGAASAVARTEQYELAKQMITVHSQTRMFGPRPAGQPDIVVWNDNNYVVIRSNPWSHYGQGFTMAECELQDTTGPAT